MFTQWFCPSDPWWVLNGGGFKSIHRGLPICRESYGVEFHQSPTVADRFTRHGRTTCKSGNQIATLVEDAPSHHR